jgi:uncharacterized protein (TIGR02302 family)
LLSGATSDPSEPARDPDAVSRLQLGQALQRAKYAIAWERGWPHLARLLTLAGLFLVVSWAGLWLALPFIARAVGLGLFGLGALWALVPLLRFRWPSREEGLSRLDRGTGIRHRPATALTDTLVTQDPVALALWQAQRERTLASIKRIRAGLPSPRLAIHDPWALRALVAVMMVAAYVAAGDERSMRVAAAFDWNGVLAPANIRVDAWVTPPVYTGKPPIILSAANKEATGPAAGPLPVPAGSTLIVRSSGGTLDVVAGGGVTEIAPAEQAPKGTNERHFTIAGDGTAHVRAPSGSRSGSSTPRPIAPRPSRWPKTRNVRPAVRCRCPTRSRMITASPKRRRVLSRAPGTPRKIPRSRGHCSRRRNSRWCCRMRGPATASARPSRISARILTPAPTSR